MPNHVHWLMQPMEGFALSGIMRPLKGHTAFQILQILGRKGEIWQMDYFDRYIRDLEHFDRAVRYIENNPVKAGLCGEVEDWRYSSAYPANRARLEQK